VVEPRAGSGVLVASASESGVTVLDAAACGVFVAVAGVAGVAVTERAVPGAETDGEAEGGGTGVVAESRGAADRLCALTRREPGGPFGNKRVAVVSTERL
jgi:hypothetical protein